MPDMLINVLFLLFTFCFYPPACQLKIRCGGTKVILALERGNGGVLKCFSKLVTPSRTATLVPKGHQMSNYVLLKWDRAKKLDDWVLLRN